MDLRRTNRGMTAVDENARLGMGRVGGPLKRTASIADAGAGLVKPGAAGAAGRARGLAVRKVSASNGPSVEPPAAKLHKLSDASAPAAPARRAEVAIDRPKNAPVSKECEMLTEDFVGDINKYLAHAENQYLVDELFLSEKKVTTKMRSILIDWIVQVHARFHLLPETLHLTVYIIDRYLEKSLVEKTELQLVGVCAMLAASKYEETYCPELKDFEYITDHAFDKKQMLRMEVAVMQATGFDMGRPHSIQFLRSFSQKAEANAPVHCLAKYLSEMCLVDASFSSIKPSLIAAGSLWLADYLKNANLDLKKALSTIAGGVQFLKDAVKTGKMIANWVLRTRRVGKLKAVTEKYASSKTCHASEWSEAEEQLLERMAVAV